MSVFNTVKDAFVGQAMRLISDPRLSRMIGNPKVVNAAMKAMNLGGSVKAEVDKATRFAAGVFGFATQEEVSALRSTVQTLEDTIAIMQAKSAHNGTGDGP
ncbi:MAG TPA: hypothetical protein VGL59_05130 [Polyangia bacterium]|jgi:hypothetical protein